MHTERADDGSTARETSVEAAVMAGEAMRRETRGEALSVRRGSRRVARGAAAFVVTAVVFGSGTVAAAPDVAESEVPSHAAPGSPIAPGPPIAEAPAAVAPSLIPSTVEPSLPDATEGAATAVGAPTEGTPASDPEPESVASEFGASSADAPTDTELEVAERVTVDPDDTPRPLDRSAVVLYGDSLAWEARNIFGDILAARPGLHVVTRTHGGIAICDRLDAMAEDAATLAPGMVVLEFSGNSFTKCMRDATGQPLTGAAVIDRYAADVERAIAVFTNIGAQVVLAGAPASLAEAGRVGHGAGMNELYRSVALAHAGVRYVDAGAAVLADGRWTSTLPCLPEEPCTGGADADGVGVNVVRALDGLHFCPAGADAVRGVTGDCPVWASGAFRYGAALAAPVIESFDA